MTTHKSHQPRFQAIIFDMDGLLVDSEVVWYQAESDLVAARGQVYTEEVREKIVGLRVDHFMDIIRVHYNFLDALDDLVTEVNDRMLKLIPKVVKPHTGALELLDYVVRNDIPRAIASNSSPIIIDATLKAQGWDDIFTVRCSGDDENKGKPAPDVYLTAARQLGVNPHDCLGLEDSLNGSKAVVAAGMTCFAVPDASHTKDFERYRAITPHVFHNLHEVLAELQRS
jgi:mannitol-1-/sugar-/sorbitol-6-/2-deoxyglucose-6-phosphatase